MAVRLPIVLLLTALIFITVSQSNELWGFDRMAEIYNPESSNILKDLILRWKNWVIKAIKAILKPWVKHKMH